MSCICCYEDFIALPALCDEMAVCRTRDCPYRAVSSHPQRQPAVTPPQQGILHFLSNIRLYRHRGFIDAHS
jgi:hypothetical protein